MKKLICTQEVEAAAAKGEKVIYIECNTIITPSAKDAAAEHGIEFSTEYCPCCGGSGAPAPAAPQASCQGGIDSDVIYKALTAMMEKGMLGDIMSLVGDAPYVSETSGDGFLKLVRGNTAKWEPLDTGNPADKVFYNELIGADDGSSMGAGFITIEKCEFPWDVACEELYYVVEGTLTVEKDGKVYTAHAGDALFFQNGAKLKFGSPDKMKAFYVTH